MFNWTGTVSIFNLSNLGVYTGNTLIYISTTITILMTFYLLGKKIKKNCKIRKKI